MRGISILAYRRMRDKTFLMLQNNMRWRDFVWEFNNWKKFHFYLRALEILIQTHHPILEFCHKKTAPTSDLQIYFTKSAHNLKNGVSEWSFAVAFHLMPFHVYELRRECIYLFSPLCPHPILFFLPFPSPLLTEFSAQGLCSDSRETKKLKKKKVWKSGSVWHGLEKFANKIYDSCPRASLQFLS